jgi:rhodanese-related sulfurtransferase
MQIDDTNQHVIDLRTPTETQENDIDDENNHDNDDEQPPSIELTPHTTQITQVDASPPSSLQSIINTQ